MIPSDKINLIQKKIQNQAIAVDDDEKFLNFNIDDLEIGSIDEFVEFETNGLIKFKKACLVEINCNVWIQSTNGQARPWLLLTDVTNNKVIAEAIDDNNSKLTTLNINNYPLKAAENQEIGLSVETLEDITINQNSGRQNSYINIKILRW